MTATLLGNWEPHSPEWYGARAGRIGGSDLAAILGISPWATRDDLLAEKRAQLADDWTPAPTTASQQRGIWLEPALLAYAADRGYPADPARNGTYAADWQLVNPDGITNTGELVEAKSVRMRTPDKWGRGGTDQIPANYEAQVQWGCGLLGLDRWVMPVISTKADGDGGSDFVFSLYKGKADPVIFRALVRRAADFHRELTQGAA